MAERDELSDETLATILVKDQIIRLDKVIKKDQAEFEQKNKKQKRKESIIRFAINTVMIAIPLTIVSLKCESIKKQTFEYALIKADANKDGITTIEEQDVFKDASRLDNQYTRPRYIQTLSNGYKIEYTTTGWLPGFRYPLLDAKDVNKYLNSTLDDKIGNK